MRKGALNISLETIIGLVIAAILIPGLFFFIVNLLDLFANKPEQGTLNSFEGLTVRINQLTNATGEKKVDILGQKLEIKSDENKLYIDVPYYIQNDFGLIGFDRDTIGQTCGLRNLDLKKPAQCLKLPCLCLVRSEWNKFSPQQCETIKNVRYIYATTNSAANEGKTHSIGYNSNLAMWNGCGGPASFRVKTIRVLKVPAGDKLSDLLFVIPAPAQTS